ncbi:hypothetical protein LMG33818_002286 [Halomonadaceae bacterium LMG 33818]
MKYITFLFLTLFSCILLTNVAFARCGALGCMGTGSNPHSHYVRGYYTSGYRYNSYRMSRLRNIYGYHRSMTSHYVRGHYQTNPNQTQYDNYGTRGNYNYHNHRFGTRIPHY